MRQNIEEERAWRSREKRIGIAGDWKSLAAWNSREQDRHRDWQARRFLAVALATSAYNPEYEDSDDEILAAR